MIVDAHLHIWDLERADYPWLGPDLGDINRTITFDEIAPDLAAHGIGAGVLVQAADNADDTDVMLDAAERHPQIVAVVAWAPLDDPAHLPQRLDWLVARPVVRAVRTLFHARPREWATSGPVDQGLAILESAGLALDFVTSGPGALADVPTIGARHPTLRIVIDHLGKPPIGGTLEQRSEWRALLAAAAANPLTHAKVSGLYSSVGDMGDWSLDAVRPFFDDALDLFGPDRLMYGGDWPISERAGGYSRSWDAVQQFVDPLAEEEREAILGGTALSFYREVVPMSRS